MGSRLGEMSANLARNIREGRVRFVMGVCTADGTQSWAFKQAVNTPLIRAATEPVKQDLSPHILRT